MFRRCNQLHDIPGSWARASYISFSISLPLLFLHSFLVDWNVLISRHYVFEVRSTKLGTAWAQLNDPALTPVLVDLDRASRIRVDDVPTAPLHLVDRVQAALLLRHYESRSVVLRAPRSLPYRTVIAVIDQLYDVSGGCLLVDTGDDSRPQLPHLYSKPASN